MKNKVIGIFAPRLNKNHIVFYDSLSILFNNEGIDVHFFIDKWFEDKIKLKNGNKFYLKKNQSETLFYLKYKSQLKKLDYLIVEPDTSKLLLAAFALITNLNYSLVVHNANYWLKPNKNLGFKKTIIKILNKIIFDKSTSIIVVNSNVKKYISSYTNKNIHYFPFNLSDNSQHASKQFFDSKLNLVVPGNVSSKRRNYKVILDGFQIALKYRDDLRLVLLGNLDTNELDVFKTIMEIKKAYPDNIKYWDCFIDEKEYEQFIDSATLFIAPLNQFFKTDISLEEYGITKETGVTSFIRKNKKYCISPHYLVYEDDIKHLIIKYKSIKDFSKIIIELKNPFNSIPNDLNFQSYIHEINKELNKFLYK